MSLSIELENVYKKILCKQKSHTIQSCGSGAIKKRLAEKNNTGFEGAEDTINARTSWGFIYFLTGVGEYQKPCLYKLQVWIRLTYRLF